MKLHSKIKHLLQDNIIVKNLKEKKKSIEDFHSELVKEQKFNRRLIVIKFII